MSGFAEPDALEAERAARSGAGQRAAYGRGRRRPGVHARTRLMDEVGWTMGLVSGVLGSFWAVG